MFKVEKSLFGLNFNFSNDIWIPHYLMWKLVFLHMALPKKHRSSSLVCLKLPGSFTCDLMCFMALATELDSAAGRGGGWLVDDRSLKYTKTNMSRIIYQPKLTISVRQLKSLNRDVSSMSNRLTQYMQIQRKPPRFSILLPGTKIVINGHNPTYSLATWHLDSLCGSLRLSNVMCRRAPWPGSYTQILFGRS